MTPPTLYVVSEWVAYESESVEAILLDEAEAFAVVAADTADAEATRARTGMRTRGRGRTVAAWRWDGVRYVQDDAWPADTRVTP